MAIVSDPYPAPVGVPDPCSPTPDPHTVTPGAKFNVSVGQVPPPPAAGVTNPGPVQIAGAQPSARKRTITNFGDGAAGSPPATGSFVFVGPVSQKSNLLSSGARIPAGGSRDIATVEEIWAVSDPTGLPAQGFNVVDVVTEYD